MLEINGTEIAENVVVQHEVSATANIPGRPGIDLDPKKEDEPGENEEFPQYRALVSSLLLLSVMTRLGIANAPRACAYQSHNTSPPH